MYALYTISSCLSWQWARQEKLKIRITINLHHNEESQKGTKECKMSHIFVLFLFGLILYVSVKSYGHV